MSVKKYKLSFLPLFESDLIEITDYITNNLNNPEVALRLVDGIEITINRRLETPLTFTPYPTSKNRLYPYYRINSSYKESVSCSNLLYNFLISFFII